MDVEVNLIVLFLFFLLGSIYFFVFGVFFEIIF